MKKILKDVLALYTLVYKSVFSLTLTLAILSLLPPIMVLFMGQSSGFSMGLSFFFLLIAPLFQGAMILMIGRYYQGNSILPNAALKIAFSKYIDLLAAFVFTMVAVIAGGILFILPGLFIMIMLVMLMPAIMLDDEPCTKAIQTSWTLVWGNWWYTFALIFIATLFPMILSFTIMKLPPNNQVALYKILLQAGVQLIFIPFSLTMMVRLYHDLKSKKELAPR